MATNNFAAYAEDVLAPVRALNELAITRTEDVMQAHIERMQKYTAVALEGWRDALAIEDIEGAQKYYAKQGEAAKQMVEEFVADAKAAADFGRNYGAEVQQILTEGVKKAAPKKAAAK